MVLVFKTSHMPAQISHGAGRDFARKDALTSGVTTTTRIHLQAVAQTKDKGELVVANGFQLLHQFEHKK